ncbi:MAG: DUF427 domain-containing protein [Sphingomonadaceae bacterium]
MKRPGPDHPIDIAPFGGRVRVKAGGETIADSARALTLKEADYPPVHYLPRGDVDMERLERTDRRTHCPFKGDASHFSIAADDGRIENAAWSYEEPLPAVGEIRGRLAFYPDKVTIETVPFG